MSNSTLRTATSQRQAVIEQDKTHKKTSIICCVLFTETALAPLELYV